MLERQHAMRREGPVQYEMAAKKKTKTKTKTKKKSKAKKPAEVIIPDKLYFRIGEVAKLCRLPSYVLRFWESEFPQLKPTKSGAGQRMYRRSDVQCVVRIKGLLYDHGYTIAGARQQLRTEGRKTKEPGLPFPEHLPAGQWKAVRQELREILGILSTRHR